MCYVSQDVGWCYIVFLGKEASDYKVFPHKELDFRSSINTIIRIIDFRSSINTVIRIMLNFPTFELLT
jgi:hypothetical protein